MSLKDERSKGACSDREIKFRICMEKGILAIGWGITATVNSWQEYCLTAKKVYKNDKGFERAIKALAEMQEGDLVWTKNPVTDEWFLSRIVDKNPFPGICYDLQEFDICSYRLCEFLSLKIPQEICEQLNSKKIVKLQTASRITDENLINATNALIK